MAVITFPDLKVQKLTWGVLQNEFGSRSAFGSQTVQITEPWWTAAFTIELMNEDQADVLYGFIMSLEGSKNQLALHNLGRPQPLGSMRDSPVLSSAIVAGAATLPITGGTPYSTLRIGDMLGMGTGLTTQLFMVQAPVTLNGAGAGSVSVLQRARNDFPISTPVVWDKPKALFRRSDARSTEWTYTQMTMSGMSMAFVEDPRA